MTLTAEIIKQTLHKIDLLKRPYVIFINPVQAAELKSVLPRIEEEVVIQETEYIEVGKAIAIERKKLEEWANENEFE